MSLSRRELLRAVASAFTAGPSFPSTFADANRAAHRYLFSGDGSDEWAVDVAPMLKDASMLCKHYEEISRDGDHLRKAVS